MAQSLSRRELLLALGSVCGGFGGSSRPAAADTEAGGVGECDDTLKGTGGLQGRTARVGKGARLRARLVTEMSNKRVDRAARQLPSPGSRKAAGRTDVLKRRFYMHVTVGSYCAMATILCVNSVLCPLGHASCLCPLCLSLIHI